MFVLAMAGVLLVVVVLAPDWAPRSWRQACVARVPALARVWPDPIVSPGAVHRLINRVRPAPAAAPGGRRAHRSGTAPASSAVPGAPPPGTVGPLPPHARRPKRGRASSVLLVDDSATIRQSLRRVLERWGYRVEEASNGREAWGRLQKARPDLVVSDIDMPVMSGLDLVRLMKSDLVLMDVPVILITSDPYLHMQAAQEGGVAGLLSKPFDDVALIDQVRYVLQE